MNTLVDNNAVATVSFTEMRNGSRDDYLLLAKHERRYNENLTDRLFTALRELEESCGGYQISRLAHSLQSATRAFRAGEDDEMVVAALFHDIGDALAPHSHSEMAAAILRPYVSARIYWIVKHHGLFQTYYYAHYLGSDRNARDLYKEHKWFQDCIDFCANYDQNCFDPRYQNESLDFFRPMVERVFAAPKHAGY